MNAAKGHEVPLDSHAAQDEFVVPASKASARLDLPSPALETPDHKRLRARAAALAGALAIMFALLAPAHFLVLDQRLAMIMVPTAAVSALVMLVLRQNARRNRTASPNLLVWIMVLIVAVNSSLHQALDQHLIHTTNTAFLLIGVGAFFLDRRWLLAAYAVCLGGWGVAATQDAGGGDWIHFGIALAMALFMSVVLHRVRSADKRRLDAYATELGAMARRDGLTKLANRRALQTELAKLAANSARTREPLSLLLCDVDNFKAYNDAEGHLQGDDLLRRIAIELSAAARRSLDVVARWGGDEFVLVLPNTALDQAQRIADNVCERVHDLDLQAGQSGTIAMSIGVAAGVPERDDLDDFPNHLLGLADRMMYRAKHEGGGRAISQVFVKASGY